MRSSGLALSLLLSLGMVGCQEGPTQVYQPAPTGAADNWNDGKTPAAADSANAKAGYVIQDTGNNVNEICTGAQKAARWAVMVKELIQPPSS